ncbi:MAG: O-antigen ligase domain-containing protein [Isosphaeraceae bacterium]
MDLRKKLVAASDALIVALLAFLVLGSTLCFGGGVWWFRPVLTVGASLLVLAKLLQYLLLGRMPILKSPLTLLGVTALGLGAVQLLPLPPGLADRLSPAGHEAHMRGQLAGQVLAQDAEAVLPEPPEVRSPSSLDRSATVRWLVGAAACIGVFWTAAHFADRLSRLYLIWGLVIAAFLVNASLALVQLANRSDGLYGAIIPGGGSIWAPSLNDLLEAPGTAVLRTLPGDRPGGPGAAHAVLLPVRPFLLGTTMGGGGAFLALGMMAMPLAMAVSLHLIAPRGSRESFADRLGQAGQGSLVVLLLLYLFAGAFLLALISAPWQCLPLALGLAAVGMPALIRPGSRWSAFGLIVLLLAGAGLGGSLRTAWPDLLGGQVPVRPPDLDSARGLWSEALGVIRAFPYLGSGLGTCGTVDPYFKSDDPTSNTAMSTLLQWASEAGAAGLGILAIGLLWCLIRLPIGLSRVGRFDRSLAHGLIGAALSFSLFAAIHWTVELTSVALSASALGGTCNRWLAGGTDLFVDRR